MHKGDPSGSVLQAAKLTAMIHLKPDGIPQLESKPPLVDELRRSLADAWERAPAW